MNDGESKEAKKAKLLDKMMAQMEYPGCSADENLACHVCELFLDEYYAIEPGLGS